MRRVTFGGANSLDNYLAGPNHSEWLMWSDEAAAVTEEFWKTIDTVLSGSQDVQKWPRGVARKWLSGR